MAALPQTLFSQPLAEQENFHYQHDELRLPSLSSLAPHLERNLSKVVKDYQAGLSAKSSTLELVRKTRIPYYIAALMLLGRAFPENS